MTFSSCNKDDDVEPETEQKDVQYGYKYADLCLWWGASQAEVEAWMSNKPEWMKADGLPAGALIYGRSNPQAVINYTFLPTGLHLASVEYLHVGDLDVVLKDLSSRFGCEFTDQNTSNTLVTLKTYFAEGVKTSYGVTNITVCYEVTPDLESVVVMFTKD